MFFLAVKEAFKHYQHLIYGYCLFIHHIVSFFICSVHSPIGSIAESFQFYENSYSKSTSNHESYIEKIFLRQTESHGDVNIFFKQVEILMHRGYIHVQDLLIYIVHFGWSDGICYQKENIQISCLDMSSRRITRNNFQIIE